MSLESSVLDEIRILSTPLYLMSDKSIIELYEYASNESWITWLFPFSNFCVDRTNDFSSTVGTNLISADTPPLTLTRTTARFYSHLESEIQTRAKKRGKCIRTFMDLGSQTESIAFAKTSYAGPEPEIPLQECWEENFFPNDGEQNFYISPTLSKTNISFENIFEPRRTQFMENTGWWSAIRKLHKKIRPA